MAEIKKVKVKIPYKPRNWAKALHSSTKRWLVLVLHRRAGKTTAVLNHLQRSALQIKESEFAYIGPTYKQTKRIAWKLIKKYSRNIPGIKYNESELTVKYPNGSILSLFGSEDIDALRGIGLWGCGLDENSQQPSNLFGEVISKCLADHLGYCIWLGTPKGKNKFYKTYGNAKKSKEHLAVFKTIDDSLRDEKGQTIRNLEVALEDDKKLVAQGEMTQEEFDQEWYCSFEAAIRGAYYSKAIAQLHKDNRYKEVPYDETHKVHTVWDLGVGKNLAIGFYQNIDGQMRMIDFWQGVAKEGIKQAAKELQNKPYIYGKHFAPHDIKSTEISTGKTRIETAKKFKINFIEVPSVSVTDGIDKGQLFFSKLWVDSNHCADWLDALAQYRQDWNESKGAFMEQPRHDWTSHPADVHRYASLVEDQMTEEDEVVDDFQPEWQDDPHQGTEE